MTSQKHDFQPITDESSYENAITYVADKSLELGELVVGRRLAIDTVCLFTHSQEEFDFISNLLLSRWRRSAISHGATLYVEADVAMEGCSIKLLGVRRPDDSRPEVGYGDYPTSEYDKLAAELSGSENAKEIISGLGKALIEIRHPEFDVRGYVVSRDE